MTAHRAVALRRVGRGARGVEDSVSYSVGHRIRIEIRAALHEGAATASMLAATLGEPVSTVDHHLKEMLKDGSIELVKTVKVGNLDQHYYSVVRLPYFSDEDFAAMGEADRQTLCAIAVQAAIAEAMASLWAGKMAKDPRVMLAWNRINLDKRGREELADEQVRSWTRLQEIEAESASRRAESGEAGITYVTTSFGYERSRTSAPEPVVTREDHATIDLAELRLRAAMGRGVEDSVSYSLGHRIRIEILAALHEGAATASKLARVLRESVGVINYHLEEMLKDGSIELVKTVKVGNLHQHYYSVVRLPYFSDEDFAAMGEADRQTLCAIAVQAAMAEAMASLWAGKMAKDPRVMLAWNRINLDKRGREELADEQVRSWTRLQEIEAESASRRAESGEAGITYVTTSFGYERSRTSAPHPVTDDSTIATESPTVR